MDIPLRIGEATTIMDRATGQPVAIIMTANENGHVKITVMAPPDVDVGKVREPRPPITLR
jgi:hypothetical protein